MRRVGWGLDDPQLRSGLCPCFGPADSSGWVLGEQIQFVRTERTCELPTNVIEHVSPQQCSSIMKSLYRKRDKCISSKGKLHDMRKSHKTSTCRRQRLVIRKKSQLYYYVSLWYIMCDTPHHYTLCVSTLYKIAMIMNILVALANLLEPGCFVATELVDLRPGFSV